MTNAELFKKVFGIYAEEFWAYPEEKMLEWIASDAPTIDAVEIVRCKDCIHHKEHPRPIQTHVWCECVGGLLPIDWFCADGERREDGTNAG